MYRKTVYNYFQIKAMYKGLITELEPGILESDTLENIANNKATGIDEISVWDLFQILKRMQSKCCVYFVSKNGKHISDLETRKIHLYFKKEKRKETWTIVKNTTEELHLSRMPIR